MGNIWSSDVDSILSVGRSLESIGVRNWALDRQSALAGLIQLSEIGVAVLGGDVYVVSGDNLESNYDSWYCNRDAGEEDSAFVERSIAKAKNYIASYSAPQSVFFAIVPSA